MTDENHKRCIFPILPVNVLQSYHDKASNTLSLHFPICFHLLLKRKTGIALVNMNIQLYEIYEKMNFRPDHVTLPDLVPMTTEKQPLFDPYFGRIDFQEVYLIKSPALLV